MSTSTSMDDEPAVAGVVPQLMAAPPMLVALREELAPEAALLVPLQACCDLPDVPRPQPALPGRVGGRNRISS